MKQEKPWIMYENELEIGKAIQAGLVEKLQFPVGFKINNNTLLFVIQLPGNQAHITLSLEDLKSDYANAHEFVDFIASCWQESMRDSTSVSK